MINSYEDVLEYLAEKVEGIEDKTWEEVCIELGIDTHPDVIRKSFNGGKYSGYNVYKYFKNKEEDSYSEDELCRLMSIKQEVYKEKVKLSDQRREYLKHLRNDARYENLVDVLKNELSNIEPLKLFTNENYKNTGINASLLLSDIHYGASSDNVLNLYNINVCEERINELLNKVIYYCSIHRVQTLYINLLGDNITGLIHCNSRVEAEEDCISQVIHVSELISNFISKLSQYVSEIKVVGVCGNHSRVTPNKKENINSENFERLVFEYIKLRLPNIPMIINGLEDWCSYNIDNKIIYIEHGDKCTIDSIKNNCIKLTGQIPDECYLGHMHHFELKEDCDTTIIVNGSIMGVDSYAMGKRFCSAPSQVLRIYGNDPCTYNIKLN